jgi:hypothetical protein
VHTYLCQQEVAIHAQGLKKVLICGHFLASAAMQVFHHCPVPGITQVIWVKPTITGGAAVSLLIIAAVLRHAVILAAQPLR